MMNNKGEKRRTICQCLRCNQLFDWQDSHERKSVLGVGQRVCPYCGGTFTTIQFKQSSVHGFVNQMDSRNINEDTRYYTYRKVNNYNTTEELEETGQEEERDFTKENDDNE